MNKLLIGFIVLGAVIFTILRAGAGLAAAAGLGRIPVAMIPARLRRFLFDEHH